MLPKTCSKSRMLPKTCSKSIIFSILQVHISYTSHPSKKTFTSVFSIQFGTECYVFSHLDQMFMMYSIPEGNNTPSPETATSQQQPHSSPIPSSRTSTYLLLPHFHWDLSLMYRNVLCCAFLDIVTKLHHCMC